MSFDLSTAITLFLNEMIIEQRLSFSILIKEDSNDEILVPFAKEKKMINDLNNIEFIKELAIISK